MYVSLYILYAYYTVVKNLFLIEQLSIILIVYTKLSVFCKQ